MQATPFNTMRKREELKAQRNLLFERFLRNPLDTDLALKIKIIDDQVAACAEQMEQERKAEPSSFVLRLSSFLTCARTDVAFPLRDPGTFSSPWASASVVCGVNLIAAPRAGPTGKVDL